jgi:uncharacterized protein YndB with AHSA1/START domain
MEKTKNQTVETTDKEIIFTRIFDAPRELVFETYTTCEHLMNWWGPHTWPLNYCKIDFREGGSWHYCMKGPKPEDEAWGILFYNEIIEPEKIVYNDHFSDENGEINSELPSNDTTITFTSKSDQTIVKVVTRVDSKDEVDKMVEMGMIEGFTETWDRLEEHLATIQ